MWSDNPGPCMERHLNSPGSSTSWETASIVWEALSLAHLLCSVNCASWSLGQWCDERQQVSVMSIK